MASLIVAGATGAIGRTVVQHAIRQPTIHRVVALTRSANVTEANYEQLFGVITRPSTATANGADKKETTPSDVVYVTPAEAAKIQPVTIDWEAFTTQWAATAAAAATLAPYQEIFAGHTYAAMCLGTTRKDAGSAARFTRCDYDYVIAFTEAVLAYSAPAGFDRGVHYIHTIGDNGEVKAAAATAATTAATPPSAASPEAVASTGTLRVFAQVSAGGADSNSWLLYMRTKGNADESTVERVHRHNKRAVDAGAGTPVLLFVLRPGLLNRHSKSRWNEKIAKFVVPSIPVETCGAAVVSACVEQQLHHSILANAPLSAAQQAKEDAVAQEREQKGESTVLLGTPFKTTKVMKKAGVPQDESYPYTYALSDSTMKHLAARLPQPTPTPTTAAPAATA